MEFCPNCGKMLIPSNGKIKCSCGFEKSLSTKDLNEQYKFEGEKNPQKRLL